MTCWPHQDLPGAGPLDEHELDAACWRKRHITLTAEQCRAVDDTAGLCGSCGGECPVPAACEVAERAHRKQRRVTLILGVCLGAVICAVCVTFYLRVPT